MNKKRILYIIPTSLLPYLTLFALAIIFFAPNYDSFSYIMESVFQNNALYLLVTLLIYCVLATTFSIICFILSLRKKWDALSLAKSAMIIKLLQIPAYVAIFVLGVFLVITIFTIPFSIALFFIDCLTVFLTGLLTISSAINAVRQGDRKFKELVWIVALQFVFCADVVASIILYLKLKKRGNTNE